MEAARAAFDEARHRVAGALRLLAANPEHPHKREWFGDAPPGEVRRALLLTLRRLAPGQRPPFSCATAAQCGGADVFAVAHFTPERILLCPRFFAAEKSRTDRRHGVVLHEVSHLAAGTQDAAYGPADARALARRKPRLAARNADNLEYFVELLPPPAKPAARR